jgi:hypothetical protein
LPTSKLIQLAAAVAECLEQRAAELAVSRVNEQAHLQPCCENSARGLADERALDPTAKKELICDAWPRIGAVDIALTQPDGSRVVLELKCGAGRDALGPCVWDVAKCALAIEDEQASAAYLLAGTCVSGWNEAIRGAEFFTSATWQMVDLRQRYADWWRQWERLGDPMPNRLPSRIRTEGLGRFPFTVDHSPWELRLARVEPMSGGWFEWAPLLGEVDA